MRAGDVTADRLESKSASKSERPKAPVFFVSSYSLSDRGGGEIEFKYLRRKIYLGGRG